jgi:hypothetical protein
MLRVDDRYIPNGGKFKTVSLAAADASFVARLNGS